MLPRLAILIALWSIVASASQPTFVEVWHGGDDGLTLRLVDKLEDLFQSSSEFVLSSGKKPETIVVTIPTHVQWKKIGRRIKVTYDVEFTSPDNQRIGSSSGSCWENRLKQCAVYIVQDTKRVAPNR